MQRASVNVQRMIVQQPGDMVFAVCFDFRVRQIKRKMQDSLRAHIEIAVFVQRALIVEGGAAQLVPLPLSPP